MRGENPRLGVLLRQLRASRGLTLASVAKRVGCAESLLSQVETGKRAIQTWLAEALDDLYESAGAIITLAQSGIAQEDANEDVILIRAPWKNGAMPVSRRSILVNLGIGALGGVPGVSAWVDGVPANDETLAGLTNTLANIRAAGRVLPPSALLDTLMGHAVVIDSLRRQAPAGLRREFAMLQARCAESLSWMAEEAGDFPMALYWTDRVQAWAQLAGWPAMWAYGNVRRSMLAFTGGHDGHAAVEYASLVWRSPASLPARLRGYAAYQAARGYALLGEVDASRLAIDESQELFASNDDGDPSERVGQHSVPTHDLMIMYRATCDTYAGGCDLAVRELAPRLNAIATASARSHVIQSSIVALGLVNGGEPARACELIMPCLESGLESATALAEMRRIARRLVERWPQRDDTREVARRLNVVV